MFIIVVQLRYVLKFDEDTLKNKCEGSPEEEESIKENKNPPVTLPLPNLLLIYKEFSQWKWAFLRSIYTLKTNFFAEVQPYRHFIVSLLLFKNLNVFGIDVFEKVKLGPLKERSQKLILANFVLSDLEETMKITDSTGVAASMVAEEDTPIV